jgi:hypothetical protein
MAKVRVTLSFEQQSWQQFRALCARHKVSASHVLGTHLEMLLALNARDVPDLSIPPSRFIGHLVLPPAAE